MIYHVLIYVQEILLASGTYDSEILIGVNGDSLLCLHPTTRQVMHKYALELVLEDAIQNQVEDGILMWRWGRWESCLWMDALECSHPMFGYVLSHVLVHVIYGDVVLLICAIHPCFIHHRCIPTLPATCTLAPCNERTFQLPSNGDVYLFLDLLIGYLHLRRVAQMQHTRMSVAYPHVRSRSIGEQPVYALADIHHAQITYHSPTSNHQHQSPVTTSPPQSPLALHEPVSTHASTPASQALAAIHNARQHATSDTLPPTSTRSSRSTVHDHALAGAVMTGVLNGALSGPSHRPHRSLSVDMTNALLHHFRAAERTMAKHHSNHSISINSQLPLRSGSSTVQPPRESISQRSHGSTRSQVRPRPLQLMQPLQLHHAPSQHHMHHRQSQSRSKSRQPRSKLQHTELRPYDDPNYVYQEVRRRRMCVGAVAIYDMVCM